MKTATTLFAAALLAALAGCASPALRPSDFSQPTVRAALPDAGITDRRGEYAALFCAELVKHPVPRDTRECAGWFHGAVPAAAQVPRARAAPLPATRTIIVIPGILGECVLPVAPFSHDYDMLRALGYRVHLVPVTGRGSSELNAGIIQRHLSDPSLDLDGAVVVAYSKGLTDFMVAAAAPEAAVWRDRLGALLSVAGVANGTPLANHGEKYYRKLLSKAPFSACGPADGGGVLSLTHNKAMAARVAFDAAVPALPRYSVAAVSRRGTAHPVLEAGAEALSRLDQRGDGQVLVEDALLPGGDLLAVFDANHWSVALPFQDSDAPMMAGLSPFNTFPRRALILAALRVVGPIQGHALEAGDAAD